MSGNEAKEDSQKATTSGAEAAPEAADDGAEEDCVTMLDVLKEEEELEDNAFAVLGGSDDKNCTYHQGYVGRQALYACKTCAPSEQEPISGAICLACCYACHEDHDLVELYTKRNVRCDCGNSRFPKMTCTLAPKKEPLNCDNKYNHNFEGKYCVCERPYPDPEYESDDEMIQCVVCEDWFHGLHLGGDIPDNNDFHEMICSHCMEKLPFLWYFYESLAIKVAKETAEDGEEKAANISRAEEGAAKEESGTEGKGSEAESSGVKKQAEAKDAAGDSGIDSSCDSLSCPVRNCFLKPLKATKEIGDMKGPAFWGNGWREKLCKCGDCLALYASSQCSFLVDEKDTVHYYETQGKAKNTRVSQYERGLSAMGQTMGRVQQIEVLHGFNNLQTELKDYLKRNFEGTSKVVSAEDIKAFFEDFRAKKRLKVEVPNNCR